jgi:hypothetical protein
MKTATNVAQILLRLTGLILLGLGVAFWTGQVLDLIGIHILIGFAFVLTLWVLAILAAIQRVSPGLVGLVLAWGALTAGLGLAQDGLLTGSAHWVIEVLHLLVGLSAIGLGEALGARIKAGRSPALQP